ncbi:MAG: M43 family zinc metalloprotease, partial [Bacteroidota bacterium]
MKKLYLIIIALVLSTSFLHAQEHQCGSHDIMSKMMEEDEGFLRRVFILNRKIQMQQASGEERSNTIHSIPVVIHVVHEGEPIGQGSNISDEQIFSAMDALNEDFRKMTGTNGDGDGVDVRIEFCLAKRTPEGEATNGIVRIDGSIVPNYAEEGIRASGEVGAIELDIKGLSTWDRESYMNVWIVNEIEDNDALNGIQGYAYFPVDHPVDGIVVLHNAFGTVGNIKPNTALNRTFTHEVGHYFGLYHTFHDTDDCDDEINCDVQGDRVCDTPVTPLAVSCANPACGNQQVENYMDYTAESCRNMFTQGQKDRMRNALELERTSLLS